MPFDCGGSSVVLVGYFHLPLGEMSFPYMTCADAKFNLPLTLRETVEDTYGGKRGSAADSGQYGRVNTCVCVGRSVWLPRKLRCYRNHDMDRFKEDAFSVTG